MGYRASGYIMITLEALTDCGRDLAAVFFFLSVSEHRLFVSLAFLKHISQPSARS